MKTDLKMNLVSLREYLPTRPGKIGENLRGKTIKGWKRAKLKHGFGVSYHAVAEDVLTRLQHLLAENRRPVFLIGHSLDGALSTVCSFDVLQSGRP